MSFNFGSNTNPSSSPTPSSYLHIHSSGGISTASSSFNSSSTSLFGSVGSGKHWMSSGQGSSSTLTTNPNNSLPQQMSLKQQHMLSTTMTHSLSSSNSSTPLESILGLPMVSSMSSSSQNQSEKKFELQQEDFPPLPHRSLSHDPNSSSSGNIASLYQNQFSVTPSPSNSSSNHHSSMPNGFASIQVDKFQNQQTPQQHSQSQSPISFKSTADPISTLLSRHQGSMNSRSSGLSTNSPGTNINSPALSNPSPTTITNTTTGSVMINTNGLPSSTITDQYGLAGLVQLMHQVEKNPETATLLNVDLNSLGLSLESSNELHPTFLSPFSDSQARPHEVDYQVPMEYQMGIQIRDKLPQLNFSTLSEDSLFFLFYLFGNDQVQLMAAAELYRRDWRFHKEERCWLTRIKNILPDQKFENYEQGVYCVFDVQLWRKTHKTMRIDYEKLDANPNTKQQQQQQQQQDILTSKFVQQNSNQQQQAQTYAPVPSYTNNSTR